MGSRRPSQEPLYQTIELNNYEAATAAHMTDPSSDESRAESPYHAEREGEFPCDSVRADQESRYHTVSLNLDSDNTESLVRDSPDEDWRPIPHLTVAGQKKGIGLQKSPEVSLRKTNERNIRHSLAMSSPSNDTVTYGDEGRKLPTKEYKLAFSLWALHLLLPVAVSFAILQLTFRHLYWRDVEVPGTSQILGVFQVSAKAHEILIIYSLSKIVLYHLRVDLCSIS